MTGAYKRESKNTKIMKFQDWVVAEIHHTSHINLLEPLVVANSGTLLQNL